jgi:8-oxo-dGTP pyrophosphatase MutT (NUDIX family)
MNDVPTPAAGLILLRDAPSLEVLMTERHQTMGFAAGALVFPGGKVDPADRDPAWAEHCDGWGSISPDWRAAAVAALREAFEEAGVLLARPSHGGDLGHEDVARLCARWRGPLAQSNEAFLPMLREEGLRLTLDRLTPFAHWIAPPGLHRRFDTRFFAAPCPGGQIGSADGGEATEAIWLNPAVALDEAEAGRRRLIFPTKRKLELLTLANDAAETLRNAAHRPVEPIMPSVEMRDGEPWLTIPGRLGYPVTEEPLAASTRG